MRKILTASVALIASAGLVLGATSTASAADLAGRWKSASLKMDGVGYKMTVAAADADPGNAYTAVLRFRFQDGTTGPRVRAGILGDGDTVYMVLNGKGGFADMSNPHIMKGSIGNDGSMFFPTCYKQLKYVTKKNADESCLFQEMPS